MFSNTNIAYASLVSDKDGYDGKSCQHDRSNSASKCSSRDCFCIKNSYAKNKRNGNKIFGFIKLPLYNGSELNQIETILSVHLQSLNKNVKNPIIANICHIIIHYTQLDNDIMDLCVDTKNFRSTNESRHANSNNIIKNTTRQNSEYDTKIALQNRLIEIEREGNYKKHAIDGRSRKQQAQIAALNLAIITHNVTPPPTIGTANHRGNIDVYTDERDTNKNVNLYNCKRRKHITNVKFAKEMNYYCYRSESLLFVNDLDHNCNGRVCDKYKIEKKDRKTRVDSDSNDGNLDIQFEYNNKIRNRIESSKKRGECYYTSYFQPFIYSLPMCEAVNNINIVVWGSINVGKSCMINKFDSLKQYLKNDNCNFLSKYQINFDKLKFSKLSFHCDIGNCDHINDIATKIKNEKNRMIRNGNNNKKNDISSKIKTRTTMFTSERIKIDNQYKKLNDFWKKVDCVVFIYSVNDKTSTSYIYQSYKSLCKLRQCDFVSRNFGCILAANKCDIGEKKRKVRLSDGIKLAQLLKCAHIEMSCKKFIHVNEAFVLVVKDYLTHCAVKFNSTGKQ